MLRWAWEPHLQDPFCENIGMATTVSHRVEKRRLLENFIMENMLTATDTYDTEIVGIKRNIYTCCFNGRHEPQQIDYILPPDRCLRSKTFHSPATKSDHWGLTATIRSPHAKEKHRKTRTKPIGWKCYDRYNHNNDVTVLGFMAIVGMAQQEEREDPCSLFIFTDGSARKISRKLTYAGWGFTVMENYRKGSDLPLFVHVPCSDETKWRILGGSHKNNEQHGRDAGIDWSALLA